MVTSIRLGICTALVSAAAAAFGQTGWHLSELADLPTGHDDFGAASINNAGQIVGYSRTTDGTRAVLWRDGGPVDLGSLRPTRGYNVAADIDEHGRVVGTTDTPDRGYRAALWQGGQVVELEELPGWQESGAAAINASGTIVGFSYGGSGGTPTVWQDGRPSELTVPAGFDSGVAVDINTSGLIVLASDFGVSYAGRSGSFDDLGALSSETPITQARAINDAGQVAGASFVDGAMHAFLWEAGRMRDLGIPDGFTWSEAFGINASGQIVGYASRHGPDGSTTYRGVLWDGDRTVLLDPTRALLPSDINDAGVIVGRIVGAPGHSTAFVMTPVPEPATALLLLCGAALGGWLRRHPAAGQRCSRR